MFPSVSPKQSFPALESEVLAYWKANNTFQKSIDSRPIDNPYRFYDGPPFITGTPHYGSLLSSVVKDVVGRYWTMRGKRVDRVWWWDCHGLPIEEKVQKKLGLASNKDIEERWVKEFIDGCYEYTASTSAEWGWYIDKIGRWVDMDRAYRTMDQDYMESVMWVFKKLWDKWLIYEGKRVSLYSWKLGTPISNFEVAMDDTYQEVNDPAITVKFKLEGNDKFPAWTSVLAWTTTPWTIVANMALAVRKDIDYVLVEYYKIEPLEKVDENNPVKLLDTSVEYLIVARNRVDTIFNRSFDAKKIIRELKGSELVWLSYVPPFPEYYHNRHAELVSASPNSPWDPEINSGWQSKNHKIYHADFITDTDGTGIGHEAPEFGDVDFQLAKKEWIFISEAMDEAGKYTAQIFDYEWTHYLDANKINIERMKENGTLFKNESITHRVPFCPRSATPLVQKAQKSWFIDIQSQKDKLLAANEQINWFPEHLKYGRFAKGIESAPDWCISRTRYWGAPMPVWQNKDGSERVVVSSREEIFEMNKPYGQLTKIIFVRHGQTDFNIAQKTDAMDFSRLSDLGKEQAKNLKEALKDEKIGAIYVSPKTRCHETLSHIDGTKVVDERLTECAWWSTGSPRTQWEKKKVFEAGFHEKLWGEGETPADLFGRIASFIDDIALKHAGQTVLVCSHGESWALFEAIYEARISNTTPLEAYNEMPKNAEPKSYYYFSQNAGAFNLHKPYIDAVLLQNPKAKKAKKVLWIHGWTSRGLKSWDEGFWLPWQEKLKELGIELTVPDFDKSENTTYAVWKDMLDTLDVWSYDTVVAHSLGCPMIMQYIIEYNVKIDRLVLIAPSGLIGNEYLEKILPEMTADTTRLKDFVDEIIILHSRDDEAWSAEFSYGQSLAEKTGANLVAVDWYGHSFKELWVNMVTTLVAYWAPLSRITEVLDVWMDSGSMPYAQMHYPFENQWEMQASFPADFIAEYVGQVRAWFYVMHVLWVLVDPNDEAKPTPSFTNVITTWVINGNDGRKMSKSYGNYPDPRLTIEKYGADPIRFYMLNSPLLSGGDMDFKEEQIIETVKGVMLPLWNTYSFFTTYANIDGWKKNETDIWFIRHGETEVNESGRVNGGGMDTALTPKWIEQAKNQGNEWKKSWVNFDVIVTSSKLRTKETAKHIAEEIWFTGIWDELEELGEQNMGEFEWRLHDELKKEWVDKYGNDEGWTRIYRDNLTETFDDFNVRIISGLDKIYEKYSGKKVLIVGHGGTGKAFLKHLGIMDREDALWRKSGFHNCETLHFPGAPIVNPLDRWIISKLQVLIGQVHDAMDGYDVSRACRAIVDYMDELTNWYVRLSRRRFWESGMTPDKQSAYETLHTVLTEVSKLLAPFMPFISESIFQWLTGKESVHLEYTTTPFRHLIANELNRDMDKCEHIVSLGLALRSRKNIRVRQPLASVTITEELSDYYKSIIRDELNVKEIRFENPEKLAKKICKPDARKIGPKYGKDVQKVIMEAKNGNFVEKEGGIIDVGGFILEPGEYTMEYMPLEGTLDVEGGYGMVVALDTTITEELKIEGYARDIIRLIQDMRKEADYQVTDRIEFSLSGSLSKEILDLFGTYIGNETLWTAKGDIADPELSKEEDIDEGIKIIFKIKRV